MSGEVARVRREWETTLCAPSAKPSPHASDDAYVSEILSLLLDLCRSEPGRVYLSSQNDLIMNLLSLLHTASTRIQRDVVCLLRHLLPLIESSHLAALLDVRTHAPGDEARRGSCSDFDPHEAGLLDILLSCVAKALTVQTKVKGASSSGASSSVCRSAGSSITSSPYHVPAGSAKNMSTVTLATSIHPKDDLRNRWFMKGCMSRTTAEMVISLLKDMTADRMGQKWTVVAGDCIMENILNLTRLREELRCPSECMRTPTLWLALASLCVMDEDQAFRLSNSMPGTSVVKSSADASPSHQATHRVREDLKLELRVREVARLLIYASTASSFASLFVSVCHTRECDGKRDLFPLFTRGREKCSP